MTTLYLNDNIEKFEILLSYLQKSPKIILLTHLNADPDAICASFSLKKLFTKLYKKLVIQIVTPEGVNELTHPIMKKFNIKTEETFEAENCDLIIMVDTSSTWMLGSLKSAVDSTSTPLIIVDHHPPEHTTLNTSSIAFINVNSTSTCEIAFQIFQHLGVNPSKTVSQALLTGLMFDTKHFLIANPVTFEIASQLCRGGALPNVSSKLLQVSTGKSAKIARLKTAQRCTLYKIKNWIIATSHLTSFQAAGARGLIQLGADVAIVAGGKKTNLKANLRSREEFGQATNIHLGTDIAEKIGKRYKGSGGGHTTAAGSIVQMGTYEEITTYAINQIAKILKAPIIEIK
jgi:nanoRNase/pAp phosphatase (c-di-AMP/oligoRNAs hydrolase)